MTYKSTTTAYGYRNDKQDFKHFSGESVYRWSHYVHNDHRADMMFHVTKDDTYIPAHRLIVGSASDVLEGLVYGTGNLPGTADGRPVSVTECSAEEFNTVLSYLYTESIGLDMSNVVNIMMQAHYFNLPLLEKKCSKRLSEFLWMQTVCATYDRIHVLDNEASRICLHMIQCGLEGLFECTEGMKLFDMNLDALGKVFAPESSALCINEADLFEQLIRWARDQCDAGESRSATTNLRDTVGGRLQLICFTSMTSEEFDRCVQFVGADFFTDTEVEAIHKHIGRPRADGNIDNESEMLIDHSLARLSNVHSLARLSIRKFAISDYFHRFIDLHRTHIYMDCRSTFRLRGFEKLVSTNNRWTIFFHGRNGHINYAYREFGSRIIFKEPVVVKCEEQLGIEISFNTCVKMGSLPASYDSRVDKSVPFTLAPTHSRRELDKMLETDRFSLLIPFADIFYTQ